VHGVMNDTKWDELRLAMYGLRSPIPEYRVKDLSGYVSPWDREWYYHFRSGGHGTIEWVEIRVETVEQDQAVEAALRRVHVPGHRVSGGFKVYGHIDDGVAIDYL